MREKPGLGARGKWMVVGDLTLKRLGAGRMMRRTVSVMMRHHTLCECSDITLCVGAVAGEEEKKEEEERKAGASLGEVGGGLGVDR